MAKTKPGYQNFYADMYEFLSELRNRIGTNVIISFLLMDNSIQINFCFKSIPKYAHIETFPLAFDEADFHEPDENTTTVIVDAVNEYLRIHTN